MLAGPATDKHMACTVNDTTALLATPSKLDAVIEYCPASANCTLDSVKLLLVCVASGVVPWYHW